MNNNQDIVQSIDAIARALTPIKTPVIAFNVWRNGTQALASATFTTVIFNTSVFDTGNCYNLTTGIFTPTVAGYYQFNTSVGITSVVDLNTIHCVIRKNGVQTHWSRVKQSGTGEGAGQISAVLYANGTTDYFDIQIWMGSAATTISSGIVNTWFNGVLVAAA